MLSDSALPHVTTCAALTLFAPGGLSQEEAPATAEENATRFEKVLGGAADDRGVYVTPTKDGGYAAVGVTQSSGEGGEDVLLVRTDANGDELWSRTFGGAADDDGWAVLENEAGFAIAGFTASSGAGGFDFYLLQVDAEGEELWSRTYGGAEDDRCWALAATSDGGFVLAGETRSSGAGERDCLLVRTDAKGEELWSRTYGGEKDDRCFAVVATEAGFLLAGQTFSEGAGDRDAYVLMTDAEGELAWSRTFGGPASDVAHGACATADGGFLVTGYTTSLATSGDDPYLIKLRPDGEIEWTRTIPIPGVAHTITGDEAAGGGFYCVGFAPRDRSGRGVALLIKTDAEGRLEWRRSFFDEAVDESRGYTVRATPDGGCVFTGHVTVQGDADLVLVAVPGGVER